MRITGCRSCGSADLSLFLSLGDLPLSDGLLMPDALDRAEPRFPLDVAFCQACSLVQIYETVPPEQLFDSDYPYFSSFSDTLLEHSRAHVEKTIAARGLGPGSLVIELASNDGYLLQYYVQRGIPVLGIDPAPGPVEAARKKGVPSLCAFFGKELAGKLREEGRSADVVHGNNVLAHVADSNGFVQGVRTLLADDGVAVFEFPYVRDLVDICAFDTIYHEHLCYFSVTSVAELFRHNGLFLNHVDHLSIHGGSLRVFAGKREEPSEAVSHYLQEERELGVADMRYYREFSERVNELGRKLRALLQDLRQSGKRLAAYGAAAKGTILLNFVGLGSDVLEFVADRNVHKQGRYVPGVRLPVVPPERILETMPDYMLVLPWNIKDEVLKQQAEYRARGGKFIIPVPVPVIV